MNDRFRFRAWENKENKYIYDAEMTYDNLGIVAECFGFMVDGTYKDLYTVEQCTGLKDKNGKLIFEGDVVHYVKHTNMGIGGDRYATVFWWEAVQGFAIKTTYGDYYGLQDYELEVIGNIHENAELLNEDD